MEEIRLMQMEDRAFWFRLDKRLPEAAFAKKVRDRQGYVLLADGKPAGLLRYHLFWDEAPFCALLSIDDCFQGRGYGGKLMEYWENDMKSQGYSFVLTSTRADEQAQHFYRKLGYQDCGGLMLNVPGYEQPMEIFFIKPMI